MLRILIAMMVVAMLVVPAMGYTITNGSATFDIKLDLGGLVYVEWQDYDIVFDGLGDWYSQTQVANVAYLACPDPYGMFPTDAYAGDNWNGTGYDPPGMWYESADGARVYVKSNLDLYMQVDTHGDLTGASTSHTLPTWFTVCLATFEEAGATLNGTVPFSNGHYLFEHHTDITKFDHAPDGTVPFGNWPDQEAFLCAPANTWTLGPVQPYCAGTIQFLGRVYRDGLNDPSDLYSTTLDVVFTAP